MDDQAPRSRRCEPTRDRAGRRGSRRCRVILIVAGGLLGPGYWLCGTVGDGRHILGKTPAEVHLTEFVLASVVVVIASWGLLLIVGEAMLFALAVFRADDHERYDVYRNLMILWGYVLTLGIPRHFRRLPAQFGARPDEDDRPERRGEHHRPGDHDAPRPGDARRRPPDRSRPREAGRAHPDRPAGQPKRPSPQAGPRTDPGASSRGRDRKDTGTPPRDRPRGEPGTAPRDRARTDTGASARDRTRADPKTASQDRTGSGTKSRDRDTRNRTPAREDVPNGVTSRDRTVSRDGRKPARQPSPDGAAAKRPAPDRPAPNGRAPKGAVLDGSVPSGPVSNGRVPKRPAGDAAAPKGAVFDGSVPSGPVPSGRVPKRPAGDATAPKRPGRRRPVVEEGQGPLGPIFPPRPAVESEVTPMADLGSPAPVAFIDGASLADRLPAGELRDALDLLLRYAACVEGATPNPAVPDPKSCDGKSFGITAETGSDA